MPLANAATELFDEATGRQARKDPIKPRTGGPAGNAQLTAWLGMVLLVLIAAELITLINVGGLISWHIVIGVLLVPPALLKTASTGWRIARYYRHDRDYVAAGPPPTFLRILGPLVVALTLAVLGSGLVLIAIGRRSTDHPLFTVLGQQISPITLHQIAFIGWGVVTGLHLIARIVPAIRLTFGRHRQGRLPGVSRRVGAMLVTAVVAVIAASLVLQASGAWRTHGGHHRRPISQSAVPFGQ